MNTINIIGLGSSDIDSMPVGIFKRIKSSENLFLRTEDHPVVSTLKEEGLNWKAFDEVYESSETFESTYEEICNQLIEAVQSADVDYAVPGHPLFYETTTEILMESAESGGYRVNIVGGQSFIDAVISAVEVPVNDGFQLLDASTLKLENLSHKKHTIITQVYDQFSLSEVKLTLLDYYPAEMNVKIVTAAGGSDEMVYETPLHELDHMQITSNLMALFIPEIELEMQDNRSMHYMMELFDTLVSEDGCPWDKSQTHESLEKYLIEEAYEVIEAIERQDDEAIVEELGDILLQVALHSAIGNKDGYFNFLDVLSSMNEKVVRRHPHVFSDAVVEDMDDLDQVWEQAKKDEGKKEKIKYEKEYANKVLGWMKNTIHHQESLSDQVEEKGDNNEIG